jgi:hypothetical protein
VVERFSPDSYRDRVSPNEATLLSMHFGDDSPDYATLVGPLFAAHKEGGKGLYIFNASQLFIVSNEFIYFLCIVHELSTINYELK